MKLNSRYVKSIASVGGVLAGAMTMAACGSGSGPMPPTVPTTSTTTSMPPAPGAPASAGSLQAGCLTSPLQAIPQGAYTLDDEDVIDGERATYRLVSARALLSVIGGPLVAPLSQQPVPTAPAAPTNLNATPQVSYVTYQLAQAVQPGGPGAPLPPPPATGPAMPMAGMPMPPGPVVAQPRLPGVRPVIAYSVRQICQSGTQEPFAGYLSVYIPETIRRNGGGIVTKAVTFQMGSVITGGVAGGVIPSSFDVIPSLDSLAEYGFRVFGDYGFGTFGRNPGYSRYTFYRTAMGVDLIGTKTLNADYWPTTLTTVFHYESVNRSF